MFVLRSAHTARTRPSGLRALFMGEINQKTKLFQANEYEFMKQLFHSKRRQLGTTYKRVGALLAILPSCFSFSATLAMAICAT